MTPLLPLHAQVAVRALEDYQSNLADHGLSAYFAQLSEGVKDRNQLLGQWVQAQVTLQDTKARRNATKLKFQLLKNASREEDVARDALDWQQDQLGYLALRYLRAQISAFEYWALEPFDPKLEAPITSAQLATIQRRLKEAKAHVKTSRASEPPHCYDSMGFRLVRDRNPLVFEELVRTNKTTIRVPMAKDCNFYRVQMKNVRVYLELDRGNMSALLQQQAVTKITLSITKLGTESFLGKDRSVWEYIPASTIDSRTLMFMYSLSPHPSASTAEFCPLHNGMDWDCDRPARSPFGLWEVGIPDDTRLPDDTRGGAEGGWPQGLSLSAVTAIKFEFGLIYREIDPRKLTAMFGQGGDEDWESNSLTCTGLGQMPTRCSVCSTPGSISSLQASSPARSRLVSNPLLTWAAVLAVVTVLIIHLWRRNARQRRHLL